MFSSHSNTLLCVDSTSSRRNAFILKIELSILKLYYSANQKDPELIKINQTTLQYNFTNIIDETIITK